MSHRVLKKRSYSSFSSSSLARSPSPDPKSRHASVSLDLPTPDSTPNPKRAKACPTGIEEDDGSNKENIPPDYSIPGASNASDNAHNSNTDMFVSTTAMTPRALRASRRASAASTRPLPTTRRRVSSSRSQSTTPSPDRTSASPSPQTTHTTNVSADVATPPKSTHSSLVSPPSTPTPMFLASSCVARDVSKSNQASLHAIVRALLRPQADMSEPLVGREHERKQILGFLTPFFTDFHLNDVTSLYISGAPGTGKTALVNEVLASFVSRNTDGMDVDKAPLRVLYLNCMTLGPNDGVSSIYDRFLKQFGGDKVKKRVIATKATDWSQRFGDLFRGLKCVLVLDEIDHLATSKSSISIAQIFALASRPHTRSCLRVIGISNTHTLTHTPTIHSQTVHFQPYTSAQMKAILGKRLDSLSASGFDAFKVFPSSTIALLAFRISNETGDIRTVFSVARRALDLAVAASQDSTITVTPAHVLLALKATSAASETKRDGAETVNRVRNLGLQSRFALTALLLAAKRVAAGLSLCCPPSASFKENTLSPGHGRGAAPTIETTALHNFYAAMLSRDGNGAFDSVGRTEFGDLMGLLEGSGLVEMTQGRGFGNKAKSPTKGKGNGKQVVCVARGVREEELVRGLIGSTSGAVAGGTVVNVREEEVKSVWEREMRRLEREAKARNNVTKTVVGFDGAVESL